MKREMNIKLAGTAVAILVLVLLFGSAVFAQLGGPAPTYSPARDVAPFDPTGQWVSIVTEDWRFRMVTAAKNDFPGLPLNAEARRIADNWDPERDIAEGNECKAYGAAAIMRLPTRLRISWNDESTLEIRTDAGRQTRLLQFDGTAPERPAGSTLQGVSVAEWEMHTAGPRAPPVNGTIKVVTTEMSAGYLRKNGVPVSENAMVTEYYDLFTQHDGSQWLQILTIVDDPTYFTTPVITSTNFRRQDDRSGWNPRDCRAVD